MNPTTGHHRRNPGRFPFAWLCLLFLLPGCGLWNDSDQQLELEWRIGPIGTVPPLTRPLRVGNLVYLQFDNGRMYGFDPATGAVRQTLSLGLGTLVHNPAIAERDGVIYTLGTFGCCAVEAASGNVVWTRTTNVSTESTSLEVTDDHVSFGGEGALYILERATGAVVRRVQLYAGEEVSSVVVESGIVYACRWKEEATPEFYTARIWAFGLESGQTLWHRVLTDERFQTRMVLAGDHVFLNGFRTSYVISKATGEVALSLDTRAGYSRGSQPERYGEEVLFAGGTDFRAVDIHSLESRTIDSRVSSLELGSRYGFSIEDPWIATSDQGHLALVSLDGGEANMVTALGDGINGSPLIDDGRVYVTSEDGFSCYRIVKD